MASDRLFDRLAPHAELASRFAWSIPERLNIADLCCTRWARRDPDRVAITRPGVPAEVWTYAQLDRASDALASALAGRGIGRGDRVAIFMAQDPRVIITHLATLKLGAIALPLFTLFGEDALRYRLADSGAAAVVADGAVVDKIMALRADLPDLRVVFASGERVRDPVLPLEDAISGAARPVMADTSADDPAVLIYTSGTTGDPKGVLHAHRFLLGHLPCMELAQGGFPQPGAVGWTPADWAWIGGLMDMALPCLYYGVPQVAYRFAKFDPDAAFDLMRAEEVTNTFLPPTALRLMQAARVPEGLRLRAVGSGGEALGGDLLDWGRDALGCPINEFYGQTEANLVVAACDGIMPRVPGAMGLPVPGHQVAVLGPGDGPVGAGEVGEICVAAPDPVMMLRYWNKPTQTAEKIRDGWLRTGDLASLRADGQLVFHARDDDVITSAGYRIGPVEIEQALLSHPDVTMAAVVGVPDPVKTQVIVAHVVLRNGTNVADEALKALVRQKVSAHVVPRRIVRAARLPMTTTGKILRRALRPG